jgi:hypothetical protein
MTWMEWRYRVLKRDTNIVYSAIYNGWFYMCHTNYKIEKNQVWLCSNLISCAMNRFLFCCSWISWLKVLGMCEEKETPMVLGVPFRCLNEFRSSQVVSLWSLFAWNQLNQQWRCASYECRFFHVVSRLSSVIIIPGKYVCYSFWLVHYRLSAFHILVVIPQPTTSPPPTSKTYIISSTARFKSSF